MASAAGTRPLRADAARNRTAILLAARETFEQEGVFAPLDGIAIAAGVGNATLYRNFPTRDDLLAAVIEDTIGLLLAEADRLSATLPAREALAEWLFQLTWALRIWSDLPSCIVTAAADGSPLQAASVRLVERTAVLLDAAKAAGDVGSDADADEVFELVTALSWGIDRYRSDAATARRRVALATAGLFLTPRH